MSILILDLMDKVNPVRNSSGALNPVRDLSLNGINPALLGGTLYGVEPGIILKSNPAAASGSESLPPGHEPFRGGAWLGESSGTSFLTGANSELRNRYSVFGMANFFMDDPESLL